MFLVDCDRFRGLQDRFERSRRRTTTRLTQPGCRLDERCGGRNALEATSSRGRDRRRRLVGLRRIAHAAGAALSGAGRNA